MGNPSIDFDDTSWKPPKYDQYRHNFLTQNHIILTTVILSACIYGFELGTSPHNMHSFWIQPENHCSEQKLFIKGWHMGGLLACVFGGISDSVDNRMMSILSVLMLILNKLMYMLWATDFEHYTFERVTSGFCVTNLIISQSMLIWKCTSISHRMAFTITQKISIQFGAFIALMVTKFYNSLEFNLPVSQFCTGLTMLPAVAIGIMLFVKPVFEVALIDNAGFDRMRDPRVREIGEFPLEAPSYRVFRPYIMLFIFISFQMLSGEYLVSYYGLRMFAYPGTCFNETNFMAAFVTAFTKVSACVLVYYLLKIISFKQIILVSLTMMTVSMTALTIIVAKDESNLVAQPGFNLPVGSWQCDIVPQYSQMGAFIMPMNERSNYETNLWDVTFGHLDPILPTPVAYTTNRMCPAGIADDSNFPWELRQTGFFFKVLFEIGHTFGFETFGWYFCHKIFPHKSWGHGLGLYMGMGYFDDLLAQTFFPKAISLSIGGCIICVLALVFLSIILPDGKREHHREGNFSDNRTLTISGE